MKKIIENNMLVKKFVKKLNAEKKLSKLAKLIKKRNNKKYEDKKLK